MKKHIQTQTEWEEEMSIKILGYVRDELYMDLRYLGIALSALVPKAEEELNTFSTDGITLYFSSQQILRVFKENDRYLNRLYLHTVLHCLFHHLWIGGNRDRNLWHLSCDIAVEYVIDSIKKSSIRRILGWTRTKLYEELESMKQGISAAVIYRVIREKSVEELDVLWKEFFTDDHRHWPKEEQQQAMPQEARKQWSKIARQTQQEQKKRGDEPEDGQEQLAVQMKAAKSRRSYKEFLQKFAVMREEMHCDPDEFDINIYTYGLRVYGNMPLIEPMESRETRKIQDFVVVVDTSYSTSGELVRGFLRETMDILSRQNSFFTQSKIHILQCDERVQKVDVISDETQLAALFADFEIMGGGGTDFRPAFSYVNELQEQGQFENLCGLLYFTDGKGIYPKKKPAYKTAFLYLEDFEEELVPPWAMRLKLEKEELERMDERNEH